MANYARKLYTIDDVWFNFKFVWLILKSLSKYHAPSGVKENVSMGLNYFEPTSFESPLPSSSRHNNLSSSYSFIYLLPIQW